MVTMKKSINNKCWPGCREKGILYTVGGNGHWCSQCREQHGGSAKN